MSNQPSHKPATHVHRQKKLFSKDGTAIAFDRVGDGTPPKLAAFTPFSLKKIDLKRVSPMNRFAGHTTPNEQFSQNVSLCHFSLVSSAIGIHGVHGVGRL
jgi:hypothetical protein